MQVIIANYSSNSLALIIEMAAQAKSFKEVIVVDFATGWQASSWGDYLKEMYGFVEKLGFKSITLKPNKTFSQLVAERREFPSIKFQWCATFLKGITLLDWLDEVDPSLEAEIILQARQDLGGRYRYLTAYTAKSEHYGQRSVYYPLFDKTKEYCDNLLLQAGINAPLVSGECLPCIMATVTESCSLSKEDSLKVANLEKEINKSFNYNLKVKEEQHKIQAAVSGCSAPYGCGL